MALNKKVYHVDLSIRVGRSELDTWSNLLGLYIRAVLGVYEGAHRLYYQPVSVEALVMIRYVWFIV